MHLAAVEPGVCGWTVRAAHTRARCAASAGTGARRTAAAGSAATGRAAPNGPDRAAADRAASGHGTPDCAASGHGASGDGADRASADGVAGDGHRDAGLDIAQRGVYTDARPVIGGRSASVTMPGGAATTAGTALVTGIAV